RLDGVGAVSLLGQVDYSVRVWLDPNKLAAQNLTAGDVVRILKEQNLQVAPGQVGKPPVPKGQAFSYTVNALGRHLDLEHFGKIIVKLDPQRRKIRLEDVAQIDLGARTPDCHASFNGERAVVLAIYPTGQGSPGPLSQRLRKRLAELRKALPEGL